MQKDFTSGKYWDAFGNGYLDPKDRPTIREAADHIIYSMVRIDEANKERDKALHREKCAKQQFSVFAMEVGNLARKYEML